ncbi:MAG TPA: DUF2064 domain-containing protein, partial [Polyangiaceae bacterium]
APLEPLRATLADWEDPKRVLLGPCYDGGYYLIGLARVEVHVFDGIAWSTREVLAQTRARCRALGLSVHELPTTYDVDEPVDLEQLRAELGLHPERAPRTAVALNL